MAGQRTNRALEIARPSLRMAGSLRLRRPIRESRVDEPRLYLKRSYKLGEEGVMEESETYVCAACGEEIESPTPTGAIVPYLITGGRLGDRRLYACSDPCFADVVTQIQLGTGDKLGL